VVTIVRVTERACRAASIVHAQNVTLDAESKHQMQTEAKGGGKGATAVTPVVAISISDNETDATLDPRAAIFALRISFDKLLQETE